MYMKSTFKVVLIVPHVQGCVPYFLIYLSLYLFFTERRQQDITWQTCLLVLKVPWESLQKWPWGCMGYPNRCVHRCCCCCCFFKDNQSFCFLSDQNVCSVCLSFICFLASPFLHRNLLELVLQCQQVFRSGERLSSDLIFLAYLEPSDRISSTRFRLNTTFKPSACAGLF